MSSITAFKAYDLRGRIPTELNADIAYARHEYVGKPEGRDFFYLTRKAP